MKTEKQWDEYRRQKAEKHKHGRAGQRHQAEAKTTNTKEVQDGRECNGRKVS